MNSKTGKNTIDKMNKVALAVSSFSGGGAERVMVTLANKFSEWGYEVDFLVGLDVGPYKKNLSPGVNKIPLANANSSRLIKRFTAFYRVWRFYRKKPDAVVLSTLRELNIFMALVKIVTRSDIKLFLREASTLDQLFVNNNIKSKLTLLLMAYLYPKVSGVIANSEMTKYDLSLRAHIPNKNITKIYNPLPLSDIEEKIIHEKDSKRINIVACGRLIHSKNFTDIILAIPIIKKTYPDVLLVILGEGPDRGILEALIKKNGLENNVELLGFVDNPYKYFSSSDVFVQASLWEGFGYVLAEAMACGTPVVAYDSKGAMREILKDGKYGKLVPVGDLTALAEAVIEQVKNPTSKATLNDAVSRFEENKIAYKYLNALGFISEI